MIGKKKKKKKKRNQFTTCIGKKRFQIISIDEKKHVSAQTMLFQQPLIDLKDFSWLGPVLSNSGPCEKRGELIGDKQLEMAAVIRKKATQYRVVFLEHDLPLLLARVPGPILTPNNADIPSDAVFAKVAKNLRQRVTVIIQ